jgi:outer membrane biogenesis lipoprotein LolB
MKTVKITTLIIATLLLTASCTKEDVVETVKTDTNTVKENNNYTNPKSTSEESPEDKDPKQDKFTKTKELL